MPHLTEPELLLYYYGETPDHLAMRDHLAACEGCRRSYEALRAVLAAVEAAPVPPRPDSYGAAVWQRVAPRLEPRRSRWGSLFHSPPRWAWAGATAVLVVLAWFAGRYWPRPAEERPEIRAAAEAGKVRERILLVALGEHLESSQMVLAELVNSRSEGPVVISSEQAWAQNLVDDNRLYRQSAASAGEDAVTSVLEDLERTLLEIAHGPATVSRAELESLRRRIESEGILFKIRVIGSTVRAREEQAERASGGLL
jgi:hypothetical protein